MKRLSWFMVLGVVAAVAIPASAQTTSGVVVVGNVYGGSEDFNSFDPLIGTTHSLFNRVVNVKHCINYGVIDWAATDLVGRNSAGEQSRLANWNSANDKYESLGHMGAGHINDPFRQSRGVVRYDEDTFLILSSQYHTVNANNARPPYLQQLEVYEDWYKSGATTDDQYTVAGYEADSQIRSGSRPFNDGTRPILWGPEPDWTLDPNEYVDWSWTGGGATGVLQWPDKSAFFRGTYAWPGLDPNEATRDYVTGIDGTRGYKRIDNAAGDLYISEFIPQGTLIAGGTSTPARSSGAEIDVAVWYGGAEASANRIYTAQFDGRIYQIEAAKQLGSARRLGTPYPGARVTNDNYAKPVLTQSDAGKPLTYTDPNDFESGEPLINDGPLQASGAGTYATEVYSDAMVGQRHYVGLAVDAGGRVYAASERLMESGVEVASKFVGVGADVWADYGSPGNHLLIDPNNAPFGTEVLVNDKVLLVAGGGSTDTTQVYTVASVLDVDLAKLNLNPGWSANQGNVTYVVYPNGVHPRGASLRVDSNDKFASAATVDVDVLTDPNQLFTSAGADVQVGDLIEIFYSGDPNDGWRAGTYTVWAVTDHTLSLDPNTSSDPNAPGYVSMGVHPVDDPNATTTLEHFVPYTVFGTFTGIWTSEALVDVYRDGSVVGTVNLNALTRKDSVALSTYWHDGTDAGSKIINGVVIHGDVEVDPTVSGGDVTRLWIACAGGDGNPDTNDGLTAVVVDVTIAPDGSVAGASFVAGFDDSDMDPGNFYDGSYNSGNYQPYSLFVLASDIEFDGLGNMVYMGNRGYNDNRYDGFTAAAIVDALDTVADPNELDGIVGISGVALDMNVYGFGSDFGLAFTNAPLVNSGSATGPATAPQDYVAPVVIDPATMTVPVQPFSYQMEIEAGTGLPTPLTWQLVGAVPGDMAIDANGLITWNVQPGDLGTHYINAGAYNVVGYSEVTFAIEVGGCDAALVSSSPAADSTLSQVKGNCIRLTFDKAITVNAGEMLSIVACPGGADVSALFTYSVEGDGVTLRAAEIGVALTNKTWYRVTEGSICVAPFTRDFCTLIGDASGDGRVLAQDLGVIWSKVGTMAACTRQDISGDGRVLAQDLGVAWGQVGSMKPVKVCP